MFEDPSRRLDFRDTVGAFATGVTVVTSRVGDTHAGMTLNSFTSVSLEPPLIAFCPARNSFTWQRMRRTGRFGVNVLARRHEE